MYPMHKKEKHEDTSGNKKRPTKTQHSLEEIDKVPNLLENYVKFDKYFCKLNIFKHISRLFMGNEIINGIYVGKVLISQVGNRHQINPAINVLVISPSRISVPLIVTFSEMPILKIQIL